MKNAGSKYLLWILEYLPFRGEMALWWLMTCGWRCMYNVDERKFGQRLFAIRACHLINYTRARHLSSGKFFPVDARILPFIKQICDPLIMSNRALIKPSNRRLLSSSLPVFSLNCIKKLAIVNRIKFVSLDTYFNQKFIETPRNRSFAESEFMYWYLLKLFITYNNVIFLYLI